MSQLLIYVPMRSAQSINDYFDGARGAIRLYAWWKDGEEYVGCGRLTLSAALSLLEDMREKALEQWRERDE